MQKILVTLGPVSLNKEAIQKMSEYKPYLFRINLSHTNLKELEDYINIIKSNTSVPICLDSEGAQIRNHKMKGGSVVLEKGSIIKVHYNEVLGDSHNISFSPEGIAKKFDVDDIINIDFDLASIQIIEKNKKYCLAKVITPGMVGSNKAVDVNRDIQLLPITSKDKQAFQIGKKMGIKNFALSFANRQKDVKMIRAIVGKDSNVISKIESRSGLSNIKAILDATDEILIDRGDLSRQISIEKIPFLQRRIISISRIYNRPVYVATNLLESMMKSATPTRAEVNDVVSTILMGADGLVLAAETAIGKNPAASVQMIHKIIKLCKKWTPNTNISEILEM